jgi:hypothetical protein
VARPARAAAKTGLKCMNEGIKEKLPHAVDDDKLEKVNRE